MLLTLFVYHTVAELSELTSVPAACRTDEVSCDTLELVDVLATAVWTFLEASLCILESTVHATVAVVVH